MPDRDRIVATARGWIGTPFHHRASVKGAGCDCLGLLRGVWREIYGNEPAELPDYAPDWAFAVKEERLINGLTPYMIPEAEALPGDVLVFRWRARLPASHLGIATAPDRMVHVHAGARVCEVFLGNAWKRRIAAKFTFPV